MNSCWPPTSSRPTIIKISMALLYRFTKLNDRFNTGIFTFIVTRSVTRDLHRDATTKDFYYGYHRWAISFTRANDRALGVFLLLRNPSPSTKCYADFTLTLLNREHFSRNEQHVEKQCKFTTERTTQGVNKWIMISEIQSRKFGDETGEFLLELSLGNIMTIFETDLQVSNNDGQLKSGKFESASFTFGSFEWNVSIVIHNYGSSNLTASIFGGNSSQNNDSGEHQQNQQQSNANRIIYVFLNRLSGFDHPCRVQYRVMIGGDDGAGGDNVASSKKQEDSGVLDQISDAGGRIRGFQMQHSLSDLLKPNGAVSVHVELHCCNAISEAKVPIIRNPSPTINCYDRNKQGWCIEADMDSEYLRLKLFFMDLHSVPRNHLRYISWIAYVIAKDPRHGIRESLAVSNAPHSNYYVQDGIDMGAMMDTTLTVAKIKESPKIYLESEKLTVHVEWCDSIMLFNHIYHKYDDITRIHGHQMRREIIALSSENYSLEKQLVSYQKTIGNTMMTMANNASANRSMSKENNQSDSGSNKGQQQQQQQQQHHHHHHHNHHNHHQQPQQTQQTQSKSGQEIGIDPNVDSTLQQSGSQHHQQQQQQLLQLHQKQLIQKHRMERGSIGGDAPPPMLAAMNVRDNSMAAGIGGQTHQSAAQSAISQHHQHPPHQQNQQSYYQQSTTPPLAGGGGRHLLNHQQQQQQHHHHHKLPAIPTNAAAKYAVPGTQQLPTQHQMHQYQKDDDNSSMYIVVPQIINNAHNHNPIRKLHHGSLPNTSLLQQDSFDAASNAYYANNNNANNVQPNTLAVNAIGGGGLGEFDDFSGLSRSVNSLTPPLTHTPRMHRSSLHRSRERNYPNSTTSIPMAVHQSPLSNYGGGHHASTMINNTVSYHMQRSSLIQQHHHHHHQHPQQQVMFHQQQQHNVHFGPTSMMMMNSAPNISANGQPINGWTAVEGGDETSQAAMVSYGSNYYT